MKIRTLDLRLKFSDILAETQECKKPLAAAAATFSSSSSTTVAAAEGPEKCPVRPRRLYLDNNAETRESDSCLQLRILASSLRGTTEEPTTVLGNPSSAHHEEGRRAKALLELARSVLASECAAPNLIFASGATEANHLAITAGMNAVANLKSTAARIVTTPFEHPSVSRVAAEYDPLHVKLYPGGEIDLDDLENLCSEPDVGMASLILAHNELGIVQSIPGIRAVMERVRRSRESAALPILHFDATQLLGKARFNFADSGAQLASWSAHKFHGPSGVGGLFASEPISAVLAPFPMCCAASGPGSGQEMGYRAGTENPLGAACAALALVECDELGENLHAWEKSREAMDDLAGAIQRACPPGSVVLNAHPSMRVSDAPLRSHGAGRLCNTVHLSLVSNKKLQVLKDAAAATKFLDDRGIAVSTGSACSRSAPSLALRAAGLDDARIRGAIRISASPTSPISEDDIARIAAAFSMAATKFTDSSW